MFRTLLVDDDFLVRAYLKTLKAWGKAGYELAGDVRDGEEALKVMEETPVDVVITDISMPLMDGIELIRRIRETGEKVHIIVLSCHDDFDYVKEAMRLGANEYILKNTLDEDTLYDLLVKSARQIEKQIEKGSSEERTKKLIRMGSHTLKYHFFNGILSGTLTGEEREKKRGEAGITGEYGNSAVISMFMVNWSEQSQLWSPLEAEQYSGVFRHSLQERLDELLQEESTNVEIIYLGAGIFCCFLDLSAMRRSSVMLQRLTEVAAACFRFCSKEPHPFGVGVSNICIGEDGIRQAYQQAREMMKLAFYDDSDILYFDCQKEIGAALPLSAEQLLENVEAIKTGRRKQELEASLKRVLEDCKRHHTDSKLVLSWLKRLDKLGGIERTPEFYIGIHKFSQLEELAKSYSKEMFAEKKMVIPPGVSNTVKRALEFIHGRYKSPLSLQETADAVGINAAYLSYLFKQEMGIGFSNYLQECRMECAKELLERTNYKVKDVAAEAGFQDYHYFSKTFKKVNGCSPAEYRAEHTG